MTQLSISMPPALQTWVDARLSEGSYADAADYLRDLVRRDQQQAEENSAWLRAMVQEGVDSGVVDREPEDVLKDLITRIPGD
jgi:antitoxin ParD1/3/4